MTSVELLERKATLQDEAKTIVEKATSENRNAENDSRLAEIRQEIEGINEQLRQLEVSLPQDTENEINKNSNIRKNMKKTETRFSLLQAIRNVADNKAQDAISQAVIEKGSDEMRKAGLNFVGQIQIPMSEEFRTVTVNPVSNVGGEGEDVVATDIMNVLEPLHAKNALIASGVKFLSGLRGDVQYPVMSAVNASWEGETSTTSGSTPTFSNVKLAPHRMSVVVPISKQFLIQDSASAENAIRNEIVNAINAKLEATILGHANGTANQPTGLFYSANALDTVADYDDITAMEAAIENANMDNYSYIVTPAAKAKLRSMIKGNTTTTAGENDTVVTNVNAGGLVWQNGEIDGVKAIATSAIDTAKGLIVADFSQMVLAQFGNLDLTVDNVTLAADGCIRLIVNSYWDFKVLRSGCYKVAKFA